MAVLEELVRTGRAYRICTNADADEWQKFSYWTAASDVELNNGQTVQELVDIMNVDANGSVYNALNADRALNSTYSVLAEEAVQAVEAIDTKFNGDSILDKLVEIQNGDLVTMSIRSLDPDDIETIIPPHEVERITPQTIDTQIRIGDTMAQIIGKLNKHLADIDDWIDGGGTPVGTNNYNNLTNKPTINGVTLQGNLYLSALMDESSAVSNAEIDDIVQNAFSDN